MERKFDVGRAGAASPSFAGLAKIVRVEKPPAQALDAVYFDTPAGDLRPNRITLRRRTGGEDAGWHLKLPAGPDARTEVRVPLGSADERRRQDVPAELVDVVLAIVRDRPLVPVARISPPAMSSALWRRRRGAGRVLRRPGHRVRAATADRAAGPNSGGASGNSNSPGLKRTPS